MAGSIPSEAQQSPDKKISEQLKNETTLDVNTAKKFYLQNNIAIKNFLNSGRVYFDGPLTEYLNQVAKNILVFKPELLSKLKIYAVNSPIINARTYPDGHIFINTALIAAMQSEDELAFILAHEIIHFTKEHAKQAVLKGINISNAQSGVTTFVGDEYRFLKYSREKEQEADAAAIQLIINSKYNANMGIPALKNLRDDDTSLIYKPNLEQIFSSELYTVDTALITENALERWVKEFKKNLRKRSIELSDDTYSTHPDIDKRHLALAEILKASYYNNNSEVLNSSEFSKIKNIAAKETVYGLFTNNHYSLCIYNCLKYLENDSLNPFYNLYVIKGLYMLSYLSSVDKLENLVADYYYENDGVKTLNLFLTKLNSSDIKKMAFGYMKAKKEMMANFEEFSIYSALLTEIYLGKEAASSYFRKYVEQYPNGKHTVLAKNKLKAL